MIFENLKLDHKHRQKDDINRPNHQSHQLVLGELRQISKNRRMKPKETNHFEF